MTTTALDLKAVARNLLAEFDATQAQALPMLLSEELVVHVPGMPPMDRNAFQQFGQAFYAAFPDLQHVVQQQVADETTVANRFVVRGTHKGAFQGLPPTGKTVEVAGLSIYRFAEGKAVELHIIFDALGLMQQLGAIPVPA